MIRFKKILRAIGLVLLILMALSGIGIVGGLFSSNRERYADNEIKIEMVDKKKDESRIQQKDQIKVT